MSRSDPRGWLGLGRNVRGHPPEAGEQSATGGAAAAARPPLSGVFDFSDGEYEYTLRADRSYYNWMRRPVDPQRRFTGWRSAQPDIEVIGRVLRDDLHRSIGETIALAAEDGLPASLDIARTMSLDGVRSTDPSEARLRVLKRRRDEVERLRNNAVRNANGADAADAAAVFLASVQSLTREGVQLANEIAALESAVKRPDLTESFESAASMVAAALGALIHAGNSGEASLQQSLSAIFDGGHMMLEPDGGLRWILTFDVPHPDGVVTLGPVTAVVPNLLRPRQSQRTRAKHARTGAIARLVDRGLSRSAATAAAACPNPELEAALLAYLDLDGPEDELDAWVVHVGRVYSSPEFRWDRGKWALIDDVRRDVLAALVEGGGARRMSELQALGFARTQIKYLSQALDTPTGAPIIRASGKAKTRVVSLIKCPHCPGDTGHASVSVVTPETRPGVLCPDCRRLPTKDSPVFPEWYLATGELLGGVDPLPMREEDRV